MSNVAIRVENLSKKYRIGAKEEYGMLRESLIRAAKAPFRRLKRIGKPAPEEETIWALKDVSFEVQEGEVVGIIGRNGAGKSTLLKILSRITMPTRGKVDIYGRAASLLEVGTGFHPELTGRENIFLNGAILGMRKAEIRRKFDEIVDFAEIEKFIDTPVKRYSSGMYVRLAFAVAAHLEPEILLVDEVLAVGDIGFQRKCLGKMENVSESGRTVLFVSHNLGMIESLCTRAMLLQNGTKANEGSTKSIIEEYSSKFHDHDSFSLRERFDRKGTGEIRFTEIRILNGEGNQVKQISSGEDCILSIDYESADGNTHSSVIFGVAFYHRGVHLFTVCNQFYDHLFDLSSNKGRAMCKIPRLPLAPGTYQLNVSCLVRKMTSDWIRDAGELIVTDGDYFGTRIPPMTHPGVFVEHSWDIQEF